MKQFKICGDAGDSTVQANDAWQAAGNHAVNNAGFDCEPCWDSFTFTVDDVEFQAELASLAGPGNGTISVTNQDTDETKVFDQDGCETD